MSEIHYSPNAMARPKTLKRARVEEEEDDLASEEEVPKSTKKTTKKAKATTAPAAAGEAAEDADGNKYWALSANRRVNISDFKGKTFVNIREYYMDMSGNARPGKKGISLGIDQFNAFVKSIPGINAELNEQGHETTDLPSAESAATARPSSSSSSKDGKKEKAAKPKKSNIEATSDEDEDED